jgi:hypothetical protein
MKPTKRSEAYQGAVDAVDRATSDAMLEIVLYTAQQRFTQKQLTEIELGNIAVLCQLKARSIELGELGYINSGE